MTQTKSNVKGMGLAWIVVKDLDEAIKFYTEVVGLTLKEKHEMFNWAELAGEEGASLGIAASEDFLPAGSNAICCIGVHDIVKARKEFAAKGADLVGDIVEVPGHVKLQTFKDQYGNHFQLAEML